MFLAPRISRIKPSPTLQLSTEAKALKAAGLDIIDLSVGEPDVTPPPWVLQAAEKAIRDGYHYYTAVDGLASLKTVIREKLHRDQGFFYTASEILVSTGAKHVLFQALLATVTAQDEVLIPAPAWVSYQDMVLFAGGRPVLVPCPQSASFKLSPEALRAHLSPRTKWVILNSPNNPTGAVYTYDELKALAEVLENFPHVHVLSDEIYEPFVYEEQPFWSIGQVAPFLKDRLLVVNGVSKTYAMTGWRIGYGAGPASLIRAMAMLQSQSTSNPCAVAQKAAEAALSGPQSWTKDTVALFKERRDILMKAISAVPDLSFTPPPGAFYLYLNCEQLLQRRTPQGTLLATDADVASYFLKTAEVCVVPGSAFGLSPFLRVSYAASPALLKRAAQRLQEAISALRAP